MYSLVSAYGIENTANSLWQSHQVADIKLRDLFLKFKKLYLTLSHTALTENVKVDLDSLKDNYLSYNDTLSALFQELGDQSLNTIDEIPQYKTKWAIWGDAFSQGYEVNINVPGQPPDGLAKRDEKTEVCIRRSRTEPKAVYDHCLISVNGYFYPTDYDKNYTYILNAGKSLRRSRRNQIGILSFQDICKIKQESIEQDNLYRLDDKVRYYDEVILKTDSKYKNKAVILCLAGHLVFPDSTSFYKINETDWCLKLNQLPIIERYFQSRDKIDYNSLNLTVFENNKDKINLEEFLSDGVIEKYITHEQSFFIFLDSTELISRFTYIRDNPLPGMYTTWEEPKSLLVLGHGRVAEYWKVYEDGQWAVNVVDAYLPQRTFNSVSFNNQKINAGTDTPYRLYYDSKAFLLHLGVQVRV